MLKTAVTIFMGFSYTELNAHLVPVVEALEYVRDTRKYLRLQHLAGVTGPLGETPAAGQSWGCEHPLWDPSLEV